MKDPYAYDNGAGAVVLADEYAAYHAFTPAEARALAHMLNSVADAAEAATPTE